jgi:AcrR family transcriptional regulator
MSTLNQIGQKDTGRQTYLEEVPDPRKDHGPADTRRRPQALRIAGESKEKDTQRLIVGVAERLIRQIGLQKTTIADIARELRMSSANVYRFFAARSEINEAVCMVLLGKIESEAIKIAASPGTAGQKLRNVIGFVEKTHIQRYMFDRKLHELIDAARTENWVIMRRHSKHMAAILERIIAVGMESGEFPPGDATLASRLVNTACIRFCHPRLIVEYEQEPEPALDQMIGFCLAALASQPV